MRHPRGRRPYSLPEDKTLPIETNGRLYLTANVREFDEGSISFPPVALTVKRSKDGVCLSAKLEDLERDTDDDGIPDLVEERILTDPGQKDSDGDGISDAQDAIPLSGELLKKAKERHGAFYPMSMDVVMDDSGNQAFIEWSESWRGGLRVRDA